MIGPNTDIPAPDVNTDSRIMGWMLDEYLKSVTDLDFSVFTGKSLNLGGIEGRTGATGLGIAYVTREACKVRGVELKGARVAVQGFGNVGRGGRRRSPRLGAKVVGVTDITGGVYREDGLDVAALTDYVKAHGGVAGFPDAEPLTNEQLFALPVDVLIPAALEGQITGRWPGRSRRPSWWRAPTARPPRRGRRCWRTGASCRSRTSWPTEAA